MVKVYDGYLDLEYTQNMTERVIQQINFARTLCNYGGVRLWFRCPSCGYRVAVVYNIGNGFACRKCNDLAYDSCNMSEQDRVLLKYNKLKQKLGGEPGIIAPMPERPKGMHHKTYERLRDEIEMLNYVFVIKFFKLDGVDTGMRNS